jgi:hypothetical protein
MVFRPFDLAAKGDINMTHKIPKYGERSKIMRTRMKRPSAMLQGIVLLVLIAGLLSLVAKLKAADAQADHNSLGGTVVNVSGKPEAGVWVIAETSSLPTLFRKIVVTDDEGRFLLPDLPNGDYQVWVRGYGLKDSDQMKAKPGAMLNFKVSNAGSLKDQLPERYHSSDEWLASFKLSCMLCHQIGADMTRSFTNPDDYDATWHRARVMDAMANSLGRDALKNSLADWSKRIAEGEVPPSPPRPSGVERNVVITQWQWGLWNTFVHDAISTDKRNPTLYPYGNVYGVDMGQDILWALDPKTNSVSSYPVPVRQVGYNKSWSFGGWPVYKQVANPHNPMMDDKGRVWMTTEIRDDDIRPKWAKEVLVYEDGFGPVKTEGAGGQNAASQATTASEGSGHHRQLGYFDSKTQKFVLVDTAYGTHHLQFDKEGRLWTSLDATSLGMLDTNKLNPANPEGTEEAAQKMFEKIDQKTGKSLAGGGYGIIVNPMDGTVWRANPSAGGPNNKLNKFDPKTTTFTDYPLPPPGRGPRGIDASTDGLIWFATGSGHLGRFDPKTEKFTYWETPGPKIKGTGPETGSADFQYYIWVDQFNTLGLGKNIVVVNGSNSDSLLAFNPSTEKFTVIRVPYPVSFFQRGLDGRIDDENGGWKGRGWWVPNSDDPIIFAEKVKMGYIAHVQLRPNPLAK